MAGLHLDILDADARARIDRQAAELVAQQRDAATRERMMTTLQARRIWRGEHPLEIIREDADHELLVLQGSVLILAVDLDRPEVAAAAERLGLVATRRGDDEALVVLTATDTTDVRDLVLALRQVGATAAPHHVVPLAPVIKGVGGPAAAESLGHFSDYRSATV